MKHWEGKGTLSLYTYCVNPLKLYIRKLKHP